MHDIANIARHLEIIRSNQLSDSDLKLMRNNFPVSSYMRDAVFVYQHHIPCIAWILLEGHVSFEIKKRSKIVSSFIAPPRYFFGFNELRNNIPSKYKITIAAQSKLFAFNKSILNTYFDQLKPPCFLTHAILEKMISVDEFFISQ
ncbi:hypothetical protein OAB57_03970 [Bacteriovoracaceae bacterium]|nr:hypothetical protein [Bacteriovoracaceae bacterium]